MIADIAVRDQIPQKFLEAILLLLKRHGVVNSKKGKRGGYYLSLPPTQVTVGSIVRMIDGPLTPLPCASDTAYRKCAECVDEDRCETRLIMREVQQSLSLILDGTTLANLCDRRLFSSKVFGFFRICAKGPELIAESLTAERFGRDHEPLAK